MKVIGGTIFYIRSYWTKLLAQKIVSISFREFVRFLTDVVNNV